MKIVTGPFKIIKKSFMWLIISGLLILWSWFIFMTSFRPSIEFTGGIQMTLSDVQEADTLTTHVKDAIVNAWFTETVVSKEDKGVATSLLISLPSLSDNQVKEIHSLVSQTLITSRHIASDENIIGSSINGPSVSDYMQSTAIQAIVIALILIALYMAFSFASMRKHISPITLALVAIGTMVFDISIPIGVYGIIMNFDATVTVDTIFVIAILTTMGYSINDTIIVLDRIRENTQNNKDALENRQLMYGTLIETSLWQVIRRSMLTGLSTFLCIIAMYIFGATAMRSFALVMGVGIIAGTLSSIFIAAPLAYLLMGKWKKEMTRL